MLIDAHVHLGELGEHYPEWWTAELYRQWGGGERFHPAGEPNEPAGPRLLRAMDAAGIDKACVMTSDHRRVYRDRRGPYTPNEHLVDVISHDRNRLFGTCSVDPVRDPFEGVREVRRLVTEQDVRCLKLYPTYDHFYPFDRVCWPLYELAQELGICVQIHMGWTPCVNAPMRYQLPHLLDEVGIHYPDLNVIVAHVGYPWVEECACLLAKHENFYADIAYWGAFPPEKILQHFYILRVHGVLHKILYGSENAFMATFPEAVNSLNDVARECGREELSEGERSDLLWRNAARLFKINVQDETTG